MSLLQAMCEQSSLDLKELIPTMLPFLLRQFSDPEELVIEKAWLAMRAVIKVGLYIYQVNSLTAFFCSENRTI